MQSSLGSLGIGLSGAGGAAAGGAKVVFEELVATCNKNQLSKALLYMQKALGAGKVAPPGDKQRKVLEVRPNICSSGINILHKALI